MVQRDKWVSFDNEQSVKLKADLAWDQRLADRSRCYYSHAGDPVGKGAPPIVVTPVARLIVCL